MKVDLQRLQKQSGIIGTSEKIYEVLGMIAQVAPVDISVLVTGESGCGKEIIARSIHKHSKRSQTPMVIVNCGAIPEGIIESELFGHKKGSFTGAGGDRKGYFEQADRGTIFLDEIGEAPLETQVKLLRVLESGEFMRVGEAKTRKTDVRVIAATNKNLSELNQKESPRLKWAEKILKNLGVRTITTSDSIKIFGNPNLNLDFDKKIIIKNYLKDHRVFMTSLIAALSFGGNWTIHDKDSINTSFPNFLKIIDDLKK